MFRESPKYVYDNVSGMEEIIVHSKMEDVLEKLKLLNYENVFLKKLKMKPITRNYFTKLSNSGEQFYLFTTLSVWLLKLSGQECDYPEESDDPNVVLSNLVNYLAKVNINVDFPVNKLKQGVGEYVVHILDSLTEVALKSSKFTWKKMDVNPEDGRSSNSHLEEDDVGVLSDGWDEGSIADYVERNDTLSLGKNLNGNSQNILKDPLSKTVNISSTTDKEEWKLEIERVLPLLKLSVQTDSRDWRIYLIEMKQLEEDHSGKIAKTKQYLGKLATQISNVFEKINSREMFLNLHFNNHLIELRQLRDELSKVTDEYRNINNKISDRNRVLSNITGELESVKRDMDMKGSSMTDGSLILNIKKLLTQMKSEMYEIDIRIGVLEYNLICDDLCDSKQLQQEMKYPAPAIMT